MTDDKSCECALCKDRKDFKLPSHLIEEIEKGNVVIFAGAGISTENRNHCESTFYDHIQQELGETENLDFPDMCQKFCAQPDGRISLIRAIKSRLDYFRSFDEFYTAMTGFHRAFSPLFMISDVITTNWDDFFETECGLDAFVEDSDLAFWSASKRRLLKIHGSIRNFGSIIATRDDYDDSLKRLNDGPLGAMLKTLMFQKTIVYVGYSLTDSNYI